MKMEATRKDLSLSELEACKVVISDMFETLIYFLPTNVHFNKICKLNLKKMAKNTTVGGPLILLIILAT